MHFPLASVIIPTYNRAHIISETLNSIVAQTYQNWECIIVDDGSIDNTMEVVKRYLEKDNRFQFHHRPANRLKGANACRNFGIENSKGEYIMFLDSDDVCETFCLQDRIEQVTNDPSADLLIKDTALLIGNDKHTFSINKDPEINSSENYLRMFLQYEIPWPIMGCFYKKSALANCKFDENLKRFQDVSFNIKVLSQAKRLKIVRDYKIDTYYRDDKEKVFSENFMKNMLESLVVFYNIHSNLLEVQSYKLDLRQFSAKIFILFIMSHFRKSKKISNETLIWFLKGKIYSLNQKAFILQLMFLLNTGLYQVQGIGMYSFRNKFKKVMNK